MKNNWYVNVALFLIALVIAFTTAHIVYKEQPAQEYTIIDKYEHADKHYIAVEVEIGAYDYIGYDVGDEWKPWTE